MKPNKYKYVLVVELKFIVEVLLLLLFNIYQWVATTQKLNVKDFDVVTKNAITLS
jgi:hypothetical protein